MIERRRSPRYQVAGGELVLLPSATSVQILDISRGGALLQAAHGVRRTSRGRLTTSLKGSPFSAEVEVRRVEMLPNGGCRIGAMFIGLEETQRRVLEEFTLAGRP